MVVSLVLAGHLSDWYGRRAVLIPAWYFTAGYVGVSLPVVGLGLALQQLSPRVTLLIFAALVGAGFLAAAPILAGAPTRRFSGRGRRRFARA